MQDAYIVATAAYYPGEPVDNAGMDRYIAPIDTRCARVKRRILAENGILTRHYALDETGRSTHSVAQMAARAIQGALADVAAPRLQMLAAASTGHDVSVPGFANMVQGELGLPPLKTASLAGVCASSMAALDYAVHEVRAGQASYAAVTAAEFPSRLFKSSRMGQGQPLSFDAHFLRWMLSDGAGAWILADAPRAQGLALRVDFVHARSFSGDYPTCMQVGFREGNAGPGYLDFASLGEAESAGAYFLRQDIRLLPNLFDVSLHEYAELVRAGRIAPERVDHFLGHYSSHRFRGVMASLMQRAGLAIPEERWYSNLAARGNMGSASIMTMLADFLRARTVQAGERVLLFVPESARFTVSFVGLTVVDAADELASRAVSRKAVPALREEDPFLAPPVEHADARVAALLRELLAIWHAYRSDVLRTDLARRVLSDALTRDDYARWMAGWIGQVREGAHWMRAAAAHLPASMQPLRALVDLHANEEQHDWKVLFADYRAAGGTIEDPDRLQRNAGAEALNAYMHRTANGAHAYGLLGATYIIEGTGQRIVPTLLPRIKARLGEALGAYRFLSYHGEADIAHMQRWLRAIELAVAAEPDAADAILRTARDVAVLYAMSWAHALDAQS